MKFLPITLAILLLPAFVWLGDWHYRYNLRPELMASAQQVLLDAGLTGVDVTVDYLDATLEGVVDSPLQRFEAERLVNNLPGLRVLDGFNLIRMPASLTLVRLDGQLNASGIMPEGSRDLLVELLKAPASSIRDVSYHDFAFSNIELENPQLHSLIDSFFALPGDSILQLDATGLRLEGNATKQLEQQWIASASEMGLTLRADSDLTLFPSIYHLPDYLPVSDPEQKIAPQLARELRELGISFSAGSSKVDSQQREKVDKLVKLLKSAPKQFEFVIGTHGVGEDGLAEKVRKLLIDARFDKKRVKVVQFGPSSRSLKQNQQQASPESLVEVLVR